jgi:glucans biosynthesis protein C
MSTISRRYDIDWLRVIAIGLLLIYHIAIAFQPWGIMIGFITNSQPWVSLWTPMTMLNIWRIPLLFFVSGMGVYFAMQYRDWKQLIGERAKRILLPFVFGIFVIVPISTFLWQTYNDLGTSYSYHPGHLWFLGNIFSYVLILAPVFFYLKKNEGGKVVNFLRKLFSTPLGLIPVVTVFIAEAMIIKPFPYELYVLTWHGFFLGLLAFFFGFCFVLSGSGFWNMLVRWRWMFVILALALYLIRFNYFQLNVPPYLLVLESDCWIFSVLAFGHKYLNRPSATLSYLSQAAYPVYILHMIFLSLGSMLIFPMGLAPQIKFVLVLLFTFVGCFGAYEIVRRVGVLRPLFGLGRRAKDKPTESSVLTAS